jgi:hypothetical protein
MRSCSSRIHAFVISGFPDLLTLREHPIRGSFLMKEVMKAGLLEIPVYRFQVSTMSAVPLCTVLDVNGLWGMTLTKILISRVPVFGIAGFREIM